jgi:hypothetical protein
LAVRLGLFIVGMRHIDGGLGGLDVGVDRCLDRLAGQVAGLQIA